MFITSSDDHDAHDFFMILYIVCNIPWMYSCIVLTNVTNSRAKKARYVMFEAMFPLLSELTCNASRLSSRYLACAS